MHMRHIHRDWEPEREVETLNMTRNETEAGIGRDKRTHSEASQDSQFHPPPLIYDFKFEMTSSQMELLKDNAEKIILMSFLLRQASLFCVNI